LENGRLFVIAGRQPVVFYLRPLRRVLPVIIHRDEIAIAIMQLEEWIGQASRDRTRPAIEGRAFGKESYSLAVTAGDNKTTNENVIAGQYLRPGGDIKQLRWSRCR